MRRRNRERKHITLTRLVRVFSVINERSLESRTEESSSWDFDRCIDFVRDQGLSDSIVFISAKQRDKELPLNSERHIYEIKNIVIRDLEIELDHRLTSSIATKGSPISYAKWHFEGCRFQPHSSNMWSVVLPWRGSFRFYKNEFCFPTGENGGYWAFVFKRGSRVSFVANDFTGGEIQTRCVISDGSNQDAEENEDATTWSRLGHISFISNKRVGSLWIQEGFLNLEIAGTNWIDRLSLDMIVDEDASKQSSIHFGPREKIDPSFHNCLQHRALFLTMRRLAAFNQDSRLLAVLDKQLERIEYYLNKGQVVPSVFDFRVWVEYWEDRLLYGWRRWSSDFYRSWFRPLTFLVVGYFLINAIPPFLVVDSFEVSHWIDLSLRPISEITRYEASLDRIVGEDYKNVSFASKTFLKFVGIIEVLWIGVWGFAFAKSIKR